MNSLLFWGKGGKIVVSYFQSVCLLEVNIQKLKFLIVFLKINYLQTLVKMTTVGNPFKSSPSTDHGKGSIVDDFMYGSNVATAHIYIRMGE